MSSNSKHYQHNRTSKPLPVDIVPVPQLIPHNPLSWCVVGICFFIGWAKINNKKAHVVYDQESMTFKIPDPKDMHRIWSSGYFGKASLSRSEPTWTDRTKKRLLNVNTKETVSEDVVKQRRKERAEFKKERQRLDELEKQYRLEGDDVKLKLLDEERRNFNDKSKGRVKNDNETKQHIHHHRLNKENKGEPSSSTYQPTLADLRKEDRDLIVDGKDIRNLEYLELMPVEALFLNIINSVNVTIEGKSYTSIQLFKLLCETYGEITPNNPFILQFLVYFHYKTLGWCARSGFKFSSDYILYERGPPFQHAKFAVTIVDNSVVNKKSWTDYGSVYRVVSGVKKSMVLCFVDSPDKEEFVEAWHSLEDSSLQSLKSLLSLYGIDEIIYRRWSPSRTRE
ncbi:unnamed protein product [Ambrosiozyma monospora]|uniref:tRNA-splicing endonuclease subunit Sen2 n=1 Tax=Ambrosiozyma monospora TaxID=43982 RepID=A0A9W6WEI0_AMBMO|nr:unnamed protein product [Ambrosiozyma monospora]